MKKNLFVLLAVFALFAVSCSKTDDTPLVLALSDSNTTSYTVPAEGGPVTIKFETNSDVIVSTDSDWITIMDPSKNVVEFTVNLNVSKNETTEGRTGKVYITGAGEEIVITISQEAFVPSFEVDCEEFTVPMNGGEFTINVTSNVEWSMTDYHDGSFPWQSAEATMDGWNASVNVTIDATEWARESYVKFTIPDLDKVVRVYFKQIGSWHVSLPEILKGGSQLSMATISGLYIIHDGRHTLKFDPADGSIDEIPVDPDEEDEEIAEILNDDAGNLLIVSKAEYGDTFDIVAIPADTPIDSDVEPIEIVHSYFDYEGQGIGNVRARGNVLDDGIITALIGGGPACANPVTGAYWIIEDGKATTWAEYGDEGEETCQPNKYIQFTTTGNVWFTNRASFAPVGTSADDGFLYNGYDGIYSYRYSTADGIITDKGYASDWYNGVSSINSGMWGSTPIVVANNMSWFPVYGGDRYPSVLTVYDADSMTPIKSVNIDNEDIMEYGTFMAEPSTAIMLEEDEDGNLVIFSADGSQGLLSKLIIPKDK